MTEFAKQRDITLRTTPPLHPSSNPAETFMRTLGKGMKIGNINSQSEKEVLKELLSTYRQTPHPSTKVPSASSLFRDGQRKNYPRRIISDQQIQDSKMRDARQKVNNEEQVNSSKYRKRSNFKVGDSVLIRNYNKKAKFDPLFSPVPYKIITITDDGVKVSILRDTDNARLVRHPDDLKLSYNSDNTIVPQGDETRDMTKVPENGLYNEDDFDEEVIHPNNNPEVERAEGVNS